MPVGPGARLDAYEIVAPLGSGGMGEVWLAKDLNLHRKVVLKLLPADLTRDSTRVARFQQEARAASALNHSNVCTIHALGETPDGRQFIAMELIDGTTLRHWLGTRRPLQKALDIAIQLASALTAAHTAGVVHRDVKPENVMVRPDGVVKMLDFGLAKLTPLAPVADAEPTRTALQTDAGTVMGTVAYMSPEQARGQEVDARTDIWSLGVVLYEMVAGRLPFGGVTLSDVLAAILEHDPSPLPELEPTTPSELQRIVTKALRKERDRRYQTMKDLLLDLEALREELELRAKLPIPPQTTKRLRWRSAVAWIILAAVVAAGAFAAGRAVGERYSERRPDSTTVFRPLTFRRGVVSSARFAGDGQTIVYTAAWEGKNHESYATRRDSAESRPLGFASAAVLSISSRGELALSLHCTPEEALGCDGTLARVPLDGGLPRELLEHVTQADWSPDGTKLAVVMYDPRTSSYALQYPIGTVLYRVSDPGWISGIRVSPNGDAIAFFDHPNGLVNGSVAVVDLTGHKTILAKGYGVTSGLAWSPGGQEIWFSGHKEHLRVTGWGLYAVTLAGTERALLRVDGVLRLDDVAHDGGALISRMDGRAATVGLFPGESKERDLSWFDWSWPSDLSEDGTNLLFTALSYGVGGVPGIYLRKTEGSPAVRLGEGSALALSADGKSVLASSWEGDRLFILPTGAGRLQNLQSGPIERYGLGCWSPTGGRIVFTAKERGHDWRCYVQEPGGMPRPVTPDGVGPGSSLLLTPDGRFIVTSAPSGPSLYPIDGGAPQPIRGVKAGDDAIQWGSDGRFLFVRGSPDPPITIYRVEVASGRRELWKEITPADPTGLSGLGGILMTGDGRTCIYNYSRFLSRLYLVDGLK
jgi:eukaryotic-like serine/threonine-protein kinase